MPRHAFKYSREFLDELRGKIERAFDNLQPERFGQEPQYTSAILGRLHGIAVRSPHGEYAQIQATDIDDRGRDSAESRYGADFAITATVGDSQRKVRKVILVQVKNRPIDTISRRQLDNLKGQVRKMQRVVASPKVAGIRREGGKAMLEVSSGNNVVKEKPFTKSDFPAYFNQRVVTTLDGSTDQEIVNALQESNLRKLDVLIKKDG